MSVLSTFNMSFTTLTADSRQVTPGALFLAYPGVHADGRHFISQAIEAGAAAVLWEEASFQWQAEWAVPNLAVAGLKQQVSEIAADFYDQPSARLAVIGVTGTNGKTSVSQWVAQSLSLLAQKSAVMGTIGNGLIDAVGLTQASNTTPDAILLQAMLADFVRQDVKNVVMEVSSHGLDQARVSGVAFDIAVLTNLSRDHLDYHETMEAYAAAKQKLFAYASLRMSVLNTDDAFGQKVSAWLKSQNKPVMSYGFQRADVRAEQLELLPNGFRIHVKTPKGDALLTAPVLGRFNVYNVLAVLATLLSLEVRLSDAIAVIAKLKPVSGRMQQFGGASQPLVVVDYAHTPDALEKVLIALREQLQLDNQLICVFGCGGDRDAGKRPLMGHVASKLADRVILTSDNPRSENPAAIIRDIKCGIDADVEVVIERAQAIQLAVSGAQPADIVLIAGKGHEDYQEILGVRTYFSDVEIVQHALAEYRLSGVVS